MSFRDCSKGSTSVPRVNANSIGSPRSSTEQASSSFQIAVESVSLALARHGAVVVKLRHEDAACLQALQDAASTHLAAQQHPLTPVADCTHMVLPGCSSLDYRPGNPKYAALPDGIRAAAHQAFTLLDSVARMALHAVCRSCHVRLHQATLDTVLDEQPLAKGVPASSLLQVQQSAVSTLAPDADQEAAATDEVLPHGLVSVISAQNALIWEQGAGSAPRRVAASMLQVKDSEGKWVNVDLKADEVAVLLGATLHHCTAGLLRPSLYRVVGDVHAGEGRRAAVFELMARPDAAIDFATSMQDAGHFVDNRFLEPLTAQQLSSRLTAAKQAQSSARSSATCFLRSRSGSGTLAQPPLSAAASQQPPPSAAAFQQPPLSAAAPQPISQPARRGRKRAGEEEAAQQQAFSPMATRSRKAVKGNHRAAPGGPLSGGQEQQAPQQQQQQQRSRQPQQQPQRQPAAQAQPLTTRTSGRRRGSVGVGASAGPVAAEPPLVAEAATPPAAAQPAAPQAREVHIRVHGIDAEDPCNHLALQIQNQFGDTVHFLTTRELNLGTLFELFCDRVGADLGAVCFTHKGSRVFGFDTPSTLSLPQHSTINVAPSIRPAFADA